MDEIREVAYGDELPVTNGPVEEPPDSGIIIDSKGCLWQRDDRLAAQSNDPEVYRWYRPGDMCPQSWLYIVDDPMVVVADPQAQMQRAIELAKEKAAHESQMRNDGLEGLES